LAAYEALLQRYPEDSETLAIVKPLRNRLMTRERLEAEVQQLLNRGDFHGAAVQVQTAVGAGSDRAWAADRNKQIRDAWRTAAAAKPAEEDRLKEFKALLKDYDDEEAKASAAKLETAIGLQVKSAGEIEKLVRDRDFKGAAEKVVSAVGGGASKAWAIGQNDLVRNAWRAAAEANKTNDEQVKELTALLLKYPDDTDAKASLDRVRGTLTRLADVVKAVDQHLREFKFHEAAQAVKVAVKGGASDAWAAVQHERIRVKWREAAGAKTTDEARANEFDELLVEYPTDTIAKNESTTLRNRVNLQKSVGAEVAKLLDQFEFKSAAAAVRAAADQGAGEAWAKARDEQIRQAWRKRAADKPTDDERLVVLEAVLAEYPDDPATMAARDAIRNNIAAFRQLDLGKDVKLKLVDIKLPAGGTFRMGSPNNEPERDIPSERLQDMALTRGYLLGETEVTVGQFRRFVEDSKYKPKGPSLSPPLDWANPFSRVKQTDEHPVVGVTLADANAFCDWLSKKTGRKCRLPYEAEWEYACRAGTTTPFAFGPKLSKGKAAFNCATPDTEAKLLDGPGSQAPVSTVPVRTYPANAWGLFGMHGNAAEWCADAYQNIPLTPGQASLAKDGGDGVARGGGWKSPVEDCRAAYRWKRSNNAVPKDDIGFRICVER
jgi:formylglycine-generating enzyme required for sulfatase activity